MSRSINGSMCRSWLSAVRATAAREVLARFRGSAVLGDGFSGYTVELRDGEQLYMGRAHCKYCARAEALTKNEVNV